MEIKRMSFGVDAENITFKRILNDSFLSLSIKAISTINPNLCATHFTPESLEDAIPTFRNKPILGSFECGDFGSHDGQYREDAETGINYWDTSGQGERILGVIRESDDVKVVHEKDGLDWIELTCALWTRYAYKQVKRLLKDAVRNKNGGKSVSVEIDVLDGDKDPDTGVMNINKFALSGITILGSQHGREVQPGIPGAHASLLESFEKANFAAQMTSIRQAYAVLDEKSGAGKKESDKMELTEEEKMAAAAEKDAELRMKKEGENCAAPKDEKPSSEKPAEGDSEKKDPEEKKPEEKKPEEKKSEGKDPEEKKPEVEKAKMSASEPDDEEDHDEDGTKALAALASLTAESTWRLHSYDEVIERFKDTKAKGADLVIATLNRMKASGLEELKELAALLAKISDPEFVDNQDDVKAEEEFAKNASCSALHKEAAEAQAKYAASEKELSDVKGKYDECLAKEKESDAKMSDLQTKCAAFEKKEFLASANEMLGKCADLSKEDVAGLYADCESGKTPDMATFKAALGNAYVVAKQNKTNDAYSAPLTKIQSIPSFSPAAETGKSKDVFARLDDYVRGK